MWWILLGPTRCCAMLWGWKGQGWPCSLPLLPWDKWPGRQSTPKLVKFSLDFAVVHNMQVSSINNILVVCATNETHDLSRLAHSTALDNGMWATSISDWRIVLQHSTNIPHCTLGLTLMPAMGNGSTVTTINTQASLLASCHLMRQHRSTTGCYHTAKCLFMNKRFTISTWVSTKEYDSPSYQSTLRTNAPSSNCTWWPYSTPETLPCPTLLHSQRIWMVTQTED